MIFDNQLRYAIEIVEAYKGDMPLHVWLKDYFRLNKQMGSRDRKTLSTLVYSYYRLGHAVKNLSIKDRILTGFFLCNDRPGELLTYFRPLWTEKTGAPLAEKIDFIRQQPEGSDFRTTDIFPWKDELSPGIDHDAFCLSFLRQPDLFLRIRPGHETAVREKLAGAGIVVGTSSGAAEFEFIPPAALRLPNGFNVETYFTPDKEIVVQDYSSQRVAEFLKPDKTPRFFWDACAASGGKSILAYDLYPNIDILVSDIRASILQNLRTRFHTAGIKKYNAFLADLSKQQPPASAANAELILTDVPCTGSGTWSRTPEDLFFFDPAALLRYSALQKKIMANIAPNVAPDATLVYCTCSVFKKENEEITAFIQGTARLRLQSAKNLQGYDQGADTLYAARFGH
jgi:16S rRNA (cytosine967-C5)-methyltransferase